MFYNGSPPEPYKRNLPSAILFADGRNDPIVFAAIASGRRSKHCDDDAIPNGRPPKRRRHMAGGPSNHAPKPSLHAIPTPPEPIQRSRPAAAERLQPVPAAADLIAPPRQW